MLHHLGIALQSLVLMFLPLLIVFQLFYGMQLIWMPAMLLVGIVFFALGQWLRSR